MSEFNLSNKIHEYSSENDLLTLDVDDVKEFINLLVRFFSYDRLGVIEIKRLAGDELI